MVWRSIAGLKIINPEPKAGVPVKFTFRLLETDGVPLDAAVEAAQLNSDGMGETQRSIWLHGRKDGYRFESNPESSSEFRATCLNINPDTRKRGFTKWRYDAEHERRIARLASDKASISKPEGNRGHAHPRIIVCRRSGGSHGKVVRLRHYRIAEIRMESIEGGRA